MSSSVKTGVPLPPLDPITFRENHWDNPSTQDQIRKVTLLRRCASPLRPGRRVLNDVIDSNEEADNEEASFRRVHILPYQGDPLEGLYTVGQRCRTLLMDYSDSLKTTASNEVMAQNLEAIIEGFEDVLQRGIKPFEEIEARAKLELHKLVILNWFKRTRILLANMPFGDSSLGARIDKIRGFLDPPSPLGTVAYQPTCLSMYSAYEQKRDWSRNETAPDPCHPDHWKMVGKSMDLPPPISPPPIYKLYEFADGNMIPSECDLSTTTNLTVAAAAAEK